MVRRQILFITSLVLVFVVAHESRAQYGGYGVSCNPPICCGSAGYNPSHYQPCSPVSRRFHVRAERACRDRSRSSSVVYDYAPSQVYADATTHRRFGPVPPPQGVVKPRVKERSVAKVPPPATPDNGVAQNKPAVAPEEVPSVVEPKTPVAPPTPPELKGLIPTVEQLSNLSTLLALADLAQLLDEAKVGGPYTILAPDNEAFAKLPADQLEQLKANPTLLRQVVLHHVISDAGLSVVDLVERATPTPLFGPGLKVTKEADVVRVDGAQILQADIGFDRGVIHVIDQVLITPDVVSAIEEAKKK